MCFAVRAGEAAPQPNVILIVADGLGFGDLSLHGNPILKTPALDQLAKEGTEFTRFYVSPFSAPSRASVLTGRDSLRTGVSGDSGGRETLPAEEITAAEIFKRAGYHTAMYGKWHLGSHFPTVPHGQGFDDYIGFRPAHWSTYFNTTLEFNGKGMPTRGYMTDALSEMAQNYIATKKTKPFFLYLAYPVPHSPYQVPDKWHDAVKALNLAEPLTTLYAMIANLDDNIGKIMNGLERAGLADSTIVIFLSATGPDRERFNAGLRGRAGSINEGGVRVPCFIRWPKNVPAGKVVDSIAAHVDLLPTLLDLCRIDVTVARMDGFSLRPLLKGEAGNAERIVFTNSSDRPFPGAARTQRYSLINGMELYDLKTDPGEDKNTAADHPAEFARLKDAYTEWFARASKERPFKARPIPVGHKEENPSILGATDAQFGGALKFFGAPGDAHDWITNWIDPGDTIRWNIDVITAGTYEITVLYRCEANDVGSKVSLEISGARVSTAAKQEAIAIRTDPNDRFKRSEVPLAVWMPLKLGRLKLAAGANTVILSAQEKPGEKVMDVKSVLLMKVD